MRGPSNATDARLALRIIRISTEARHPGKLRDERRSWLALAMKKRCTARRKAISNGSCDGVDRLE
jgi:hypothetical protein